MTVTPSGAAGDGGGRHRQPGPVAAAGRCLLFAAVLSAAAAADLHAASLLHEIRVGVLAHDIEGVFSESSNEDGLDINGELIFAPSLDLLGGVLRPNLGVSVNDSGGTNRLYGGGVLQYLWGTGIFLDLGLGLAVHDGETDVDDGGGVKELGSPLLFRISAEIGFTLSGRHRLSLIYDHLSNGYLADPNEGLDTLGVRYGFLF